LFIGVAPNILNSNILPSAATVWKIAVATVLRLANMNGIVNNCFIKFLVKFKTGFCYEINNFTDVLLTINGL